MVAQTKAAVTASGLQRFTARLLFFYGKKWKGKAGVWMERKELGCTTEDLAYAPLWRFAEWLLLGSLPA